MVDVSNFSRLNVADTCALWNVLSSRLLYIRALQARCVFSLTQFVQYECLYKRRSVVTEQDQELQRRLRQALARGEVSSYHIDIEDLQEVTLLRNRKRLSMGELSSIAFAVKTRQVFMTDDQKARKLGALVLASERVQTTPHLLGWLVFSARLTDSDLPAVINEHSTLGRPLAPFFEAAFVEALRCRLLASQPQRSDP